MAAVVGYLVAATVAIAVALAIAGPRWTVARDPTFEMEDVAARLVGVMSGLAGFAVTGLVFLVTQSRNVAEPTGTPFTAVLTMFVVAYMGYFASSILFANVSHRVQGAGFDLAAAQYAGASITLFSVFIGWFALRPLFQTFGLTTAADLLAWLLIGALAVGLGLLVGALYRSGYASARMTLVLPAVAIVVTLGFAVVVGAFVPAWRSPEATLNLTILAFVGGVTANAVLTVLPILARHERVAVVLATRGHLGVLAYAEAAMVLVGFVLLAVLGLI